MIKDEFKEEDDDVKAWKPPEEDPIIEKKPHKKRNKTKKAKTDKIEEKVKQLEKCIKNKDKRITKMENRWNTIKAIACGIFSICILIGVLYFIYQIITTDFFNAFKKVMFMVGTCFFAVITSFGLTALIVYLGGGDDDDIIILGFLCSIVGLMVAIVSLLLYSSPSISGT